MRILPLVRKELAEILRQRELVALILAVPLIELLILGYVLSTPLKDLPVALVDLARTPVSREIVRQIGASPLLRVVGAEPRSGRAEDALADGRRRAVVRLRPAAAGPARAMGIPDVQVTVDGTDPFTSGALANAIDAALGRVAGALAERSSATVVAVPLAPGSPRIGTAVLARFNPDLRSVDAMGPGLVGLLLTLLTFFVTGLSLVREREQQTLDTLLVTGLTPLEIFLGKGIPMMGVGLLHLAAGVPLLAAWFGVPFRGSPLPMLAAAVPYVAAVVSAALAVSALARNQRQTMFVSWYAMIALILFSGFLTPVESIPAAAVHARLVAALNPFRELLEVSRQVMLKGAGTGATAPHLARLAGLCAAAGAASFVAFRRGLRRGAPSRSPRGRADAVTPRSS